MSAQNTGKLNSLLRDLPEGLIVDSEWLRARGFSTSLRSQYVSSGWLEQPARRVYRRPRGSLTWQQVVISLQTLLQKPLVVGGRTALELQGMGHYLSEQVREVHLYGPEAPPGWLYDLRVDASFRYHTGKRLFKDEPVTRGLAGFELDISNGNGQTADPTRDTFRRLEWGQWNWPLTVSSIERAILELLDELPGHESFHQVDRIMEGLSNISPRRMKKLLTDCRSVKVKRLFFFFAERQGHRWFKQLDPDDFELGSGKRVLVKGGKLDPRYLITIPEDLSGVS